VKRGVEIFGVNPRAPESHAKFRARFQFPFPLLVDKGQKVAARYRAHGLVVKRTVYLIGPDGTIRFGRRGMPSPEEVLAAAPPAL
jgi:peroxiredoxin Q/BCP